MSLPEEAVGKADPDLEEERSSGHDIHGDPLLCHTGLLT